MKMRVALVQMTSVLDYKINLNVLDKLYAQAESEKADIICLPECFYSFSESAQLTPYVVEENNEHLKNILDLSKRHKLAMLGGSVAYRKLNGEVFNRALYISSDGKILQYYDKINLFSFYDEAKSISYSESSRFNAGNSLCAGEVNISEQNKWSFGLSICFDLRFPELFRMYGHRDVLFIPAAFTVPTGKAHWHTLMRARAIENQTFVIASAQCGQHNEKIATFGHALVISPWGEIIYEVDSTNYREREGFCAIVELDKTEIIKVRSKMNVGMNFF